MRWLLQQEVSMRVIKPGSLCLNLWILLPRQAAPETLSLPSKHSREPKRLEKAAGYSCGVEKQEKPRHSLMDLGLPSPTPLLYRICPPEAGSLHFYSAEFHSLPEVTVPNMVMP